MPQLHADHQVLLQQQDGADVPRTDMPTGRQKQHSCGGLTVQILDSSDRDSLPTFSVTKLRGLPRGDTKRWFEASSSIYGGPGDISS